MIVAYDTTQVRTLSREEWRAFYRRLRLARKAAKPGVTGLAGFGRVTPDWLLFRISNPPLLWVPAREGEGQHAPLMVAWAQDRPGAVVTVGHGGAGGGGRVSAL